MSGLGRRHGFRTALGRQSGRMINRTGWSTESDTDDLEKRRVMSMGPEEALVCKLL